ncbi:hypothetical protein ThrDRAFT_02265, partial [Frankia casuarinae]
MVPGSGAAIPRCHGVTAARSPRRPGARGVTAARSP